MEGANLPHLTHSYVRGTSRPFHNLGECPPTPGGMFNKNREDGCIYGIPSHAEVNSAIFYPGVGSARTRYHEHHEQWKPKIMHITCTVFRVVFF